MLNIEVAYASQEKEQLIQLAVKPGTTIEEAILRSGILIIFPEIDLTKQKVGVFSKSRQLNDLVASGDRIEIYRPLTIDPKDARRARFKAQKKKS